MSKIEWPVILEATLDTLPEIERELFASCTEFRNNCGQMLGQLYYTRVLTAYFRNNTDTLTDLLHSNNEVLLMHPYLQILTSMRILIKKSNIELAAILSLKNELIELKMETRIFEAEANFLCASACMQKNSYNQAQKFYKNAASLFEKSNCIKKSLRSELSAISAYSCEFPEARLFYEYFSLYEKALIAEDNLTAGTALLNISREFQRLSALPQAINTVQKSLELLQNSHRGSREFGLALAHKANIVFLLGRNQEAENDLIHAACNSHPEVQAACSVVANQMNLNLSLLKKQSLLPTWKERQAEVQTSESLSPMESHFLKLISEKRRDKFELMDALFGEKISLDSKENRLKNLISRTRSKLPGVIQLKDGYYEVLDLHQLKAKSS